jgi:hypothetical protein
MQFERWSLRTSHPPAPSARLSQALRDGVGSTTDWEKGPAPPGGGRRRRALSPPTILRISAFSGERSSAQLRTSRLRQRDETADSRPTVRRPSSMTASSRGRTLGSRRLLRWAPCHRLGGTLGSELQPPQRPFTPSDGRYQFRAEGLRGGRRVFCCGWSIWLARPEAKRFIIP